MSSTGRDGLRAREQFADPAVPEKRVGGSQDAAALKKEDQLIEPDYILVFSKDSTVDIQNALTLLFSIGFFVKTRPGASNTTLLLLRASPKLVAGAKNRSVAVQQRLTLIDFPGLVDEFPPYNPGNLQVKSRMETIGSVRSNLSENELLDIETVYGNDTAAAFEFEKFIVKAIATLAPLTLFGTYAFVPLLVVASFLVAYWQVYESRKRASSHPRFVPRQDGRVGFNGTPSETRERIRLLFIPFALVVMTIYTLGLLAVLGLEIFCVQFYDGPLKPVVKLIPVGANIAASVVYGILYKFAVNKFIAWEDYPSKEAADQVRNQRLFYLEALIAYAPIIFTAYIYLPFGHRLMTILPQLHKSQLVKHVSLSRKFELDVNRLHAQARFFTLIQPIVGIVLGTVVPLGLYFLNRYVLKKAEAARDNRFALEQLLIPFDSNREIQKTILLFGYALIASPIWPFAAVASGIALYVRKSVLLYILSASGFRKPTSLQGARTIGYWVKDLRAILLFASVVGPSISLMYNAERLYYSSSSSFVSTSWFKAGVAAFIGENLVIILFHIFTTYLDASLEAPTTSFQPTGSSLEAEKQRQVNDTPIDAKQDALWSR